MVIIIHIVKGFNSNILSMRPGKNNLTAIFSLHFNMSRKYSSKHISTLRVVLNSMHVIIKCVLCNNNNSLAYETRRLIVART